jgi:hypothetical protein
MDVELDLPGSLAILLESLEEILTAGCEVVVKQNMVLETVKSA